MTTQQQYPTSSYDIWKTGPPEPDDIGFEDAHEHDDSCPPDCEQLTYEDLVERALEDAAERRAEEQAEAYARGDW